MWWGFRLAVRALLTELHQMEWCLIWSQTQQLKPKCLKWRTYKRNMRWNLDFLPVTEEICLSCGRGSQRQMDARRPDPGSWTWDPVSWGPSHAVLWLLFKSALNQINRSNIRKKKSWAGLVVPSPPPAFADPSLGQPPGLLAEDVNPLEISFIPMGFQHSQSSEPGPGRTTCRQDLGAAAACSIPYLLHYLSRIKDVQVGEDLGISESWKVLDVTQAHLESLCVQWFPPVLNTRL